MSERPTRDEIDSMARAWDEGYTVGYETGQDDPHDPSDNPYRWLLDKLDAAEGTRLPEPGDGCLGCQEL